MYWKLNPRVVGGVDHIWKVVWKLPVSRRIQVFLWITVLDRLLTAKRRAKLLGTDPKCLICGAAEEDSCHVLRDCTKAKQLWFSLDIFYLDSESFILSSRDWFIKNLGSKGWFKLNFDGAVKGNPGPASCRGVLRGDARDWVCGFAKILGICSAISAELSGMVYGLKIAQDLGISKLVVEGDSATAISTLQAAWDGGQVWNLE
ncbi:uncharacterized protein LOC114754591 [Neltuma alba]|uniref:uncharacterized protein LOC114754591 n=1 Tax=Neltuma alba TaxID=207710 RepID=UPI0010A5917C|nr:uncharacterized protein LOC114754591 [Prosopis alba]